MIGIVIGAGIFARLYPRLDRTVLNKGVFPAETIPELLGIRARFIVPVVAVLIVGILYLLQAIGF
jgi:xanthosine utilization system XapX-like protein